MALVHVATITPTKAEVLLDWLDRAPWADGDDAIDLVGAYRFDDPEGEVGLETHLVRRGGVTFHVPLTYRGAPLPGVEPVGVMEHSVLGTRYLYDGMVDPAFTRMLAAVTLTGAGQAATVLIASGRVTTRSPNVRLSGGAWAGEMIEVGDLGEPVERDGWSAVRGSAVELWLRRRLDAAPLHDADAYVLHGTWAGQVEPAVLAVARAIGAEAN